MFVAVEYFSLPTSLHGLEIAEGSTEELASLAPRVGHLPHWAKLYVITSLGQRHLIIAGGWSLERNRLGMFESSFGQSPPGSTVVASSGP